MVSRTLSRRDFIRWSIAAGGGAALAACSSPAPTATPVPATKAPAPTGAPTVAPAPVATAAPQTKPIEIPEIYKWAPDPNLQMIDTTKYKKPGPYKIGLANVSTTNAWAVIYWETVKWEVSKHPEIAQFFATDAGDSPAKQLSDVEDLIAKGVDALIVRPCTVDAAVPAIEKAMDMGIPVIISNRSTSTTKYVTQNTTPATEIGRLQGKWLAAQLKGKGKIVSIEGPAGSGPQIERFQGAMSELARYPDIQILARKATMWSRAEAKTAMEDYLQAFKQIDGVLSQAGMMSIGAAEALAEAGIPACKIPMTGDDYNGWMKWIAANKCGMIATNPNYQGAVSIVAALMILNGQPVPKQWNIPSKAYDASTIHEVVVPNRTDEWYPSILPADWKITGS